MIPPKIDDVIYEQPLSDAAKRIDKLNLQMVGGEAQIARSDILVELAISDDLKIDTDMFEELQIIAANNS